MTRIVGKPLFKMPMYTRQILIRYEIQFEKVHISNIEEYTTSIRNSFIAYILHVL